MSLLRRAISVIRAIYREWQKDNGMMLAAGVAFYATFSLAPLLLLLTNSGAMLFGRASARSRLLELVGDSVGPGASAAVERILLSARQTDAGATAISVFLLLVAASAVFRHLKVALNVVLDVPTDDQGNIVWRFLRDRLLAAAVAVTTIVLIVSALGVTAILGWLRRNAPGVLSEIAIVWRGAEFLTSFVVLAIVFTGVLRFVPDIRMEWRLVVRGGAVAAALFVVSQYLITLYVARASFTTAYGAAGSVVLLLFYVYFTVALLLVTAEATEMVAREDAAFRRERHELQERQHYEPRKPDGT